VGSKVKENRTIYVSVTRTLAPKVKMPVLTDVSFRQAEAILQSYGLKAGKVSYQPDLCKNCVLRCELNGRTVEAGQEIRKGTAIDLVLGDGFGTSRIPVPDLTGLTLEEALFVIRGSLLNAGAVVADATVRDTLNAFVVRQSPEAGGQGAISQGEAIDLYLSKSPPRKD
jgi:beta-lactam-binding protein with PASTA domain